MHSKQRNSTFLGRTLPAFALALAVLMPLLPPPAAAQDGAEGVFGEIIDVRVVNLEVVVTDRQGNRVPDLKPEDFRLRVDGQEVSIDFFNEVREGTAVASGEGAAENAPGIEGGKAVSTSYLVFIDEVFPLARDRNRAIQGLQEALPLLGPEDRMAVAAFNGRQLEMLTTWSQSPTELDRILERVKGRRSGSFLYARDREFAGDEAAELDVDVVDLATGQVIEFDQTHNEIIARRYVDVFENQLERMVNAVNSTLRSFAQPPGRKVMLLLSGGWPYSPVEYFVSPDAPITDFGADKTPKTLQRISETANRIGYTLYPIDIATPRSFDVDAGRDVNQAVSTIGRESELHTTLEVLARETGGDAMLDAASWKALERVISDTRSYYWLGFTPDWKGNDEDHKIKLDVLRPGLKVRSRKGFLDLSRKTEVSYQVESALLIGQLPGSDPLEVTMGRAEKARRGKAVVPITIKIPMDAVTMIPHKGQYVAELELRVAVLDESGDRNELPVIPVQLAGPSLPQPGQHAIYETELKLRGEDHDLVIALFDPPSGRMLSTVKRYRDLRKKD